MQIKTFKHKISMCNQMVTIKAREIIRIWIKRDEIIPHEYTIWLPINIMGDELR